MTAFEFRGALYRSSRQMHDAIAEEWVSACGTNSREDCQVLSRLGGEALACKAIQSWGLEDTAGFDRHELLSAFLRLREEFDERFPAEDAA